MYTSYRTSKSTISFVIVYFSILFTYTAQTRAQQTTDQAVLKSLGDHGDRISDLELIVKQLKSDYNAVIDEIGSLKSENVQLRTELEELGNKTEDCCQSKPPDHCPSSAVTVVNSSGVVTYPTTKARTTTASSSNKTTAYQQSNNDSTTQIPALKTTESTTNSNINKSTTESSTTTSTTSLSTTTTSGIKTYSNCEEVHAEFPNVNTKVVVMAIGVHTQEVQCTFDSYGDWLVIQRRQDGSVNFNRNWADYAKGFGDPSGEIWAGNEFLHYLTDSDDYTLRIEFSDWAHNTRYAEYEHFYVADQFDNYRLSVGSYKGTAGDSFHYPQSNQLSHHRMMFSTPDRDHDHSFMNCAQKMESGWWFNSCYSSNLNGRYLPHPYGQRMLGETFGDPTLDGTGIEWYPYRQRQYSFKQVTMKVKRVPRVSMSMIG